MKDRIQDKKSQYRDKPEPERMNEFRSKTKESDFEVTKPSKTNNTQSASQNRPSTTTATKKVQIVAPLPTPVQVPVVDDLLGGDDGFTPYVQAPSAKSPLDDDDFGQFHEASSTVTKPVTSPALIVEPSLWPTTTPLVQPPSSSSMISFDPFDSLQNTTTTTTTTTSSLFQPMTTSSSLPLISATNQSATSDFELLMMPNQTTQPPPPSNFFPFQQQQQQQSFVHPQMFQQTSMFPAGQQFNKPTNNSFNNTWSSAQGKIDISLNNLIPYTRGDLQKQSLPLNQLANSTASGFQSPTATNNNPQSMFANATFPMNNNSGSRSVFK